MVGLEEMRRMHEEFLSIRCGIQSGQCEWSGQHLAFSTQHSALSLRESNAAAKSQWLNAEC
jgi:hypothetical protein